MHTLIIAEAGINHNGDINTAKKLIDKAAEAGADYVKFQTFKAVKIAGKTAKKASYQVKNTNSSDDSQFNMLKALELSEAMHYDLIDYCKSKEIKFLSTGFDTDSIDFLEKLNIDFFKIPSGEITNKPYLVNVAGKRKPVVMSTGMATMQEIRAAFDILIKEGIEKKDITILHCNTQYPTPFEDVNLKAMCSIRDKFGVNVGYSDHTNGIEVPIAAVALGATIIEKHFTIDRNLPGPDHKASLEPDELKAMVSAIRNIEKALSGSGIKEVSRSETENIQIARKSIVAAKRIAKGEIYTTDNLTVKRPGNGISPMKWDEIIGQKAIKDFDEDELIEM